MERGDHFARGDRVGRYILLDQLGAGGLGVVYKAFDPDLERNVAIKLVRVDRSDAAAGARLEREARAIAQLSHANVVAVYDVGLVGDQVFVAMEYVEGATLAEWVSAQRRSLREVVTVFTRAGRGLSAAHAAGIVHRDFKPHNVLVTPTGAVRVADFGLARASETSASETSALHLSDRPLLAAGTLATITNAGAMVGTPAYMAPEQHAGLPADTRSDQYAFCVSLYEAVYGRRPFAGTDRDELAGNKRALAISPDPDTGATSTPASSRVPKWLARPVMRGLSVDPAARFASMDALLSRLARDGRAQRRRFAIAGLAALAATALTLLFAGRAANELCAGARDELAGIWDEPRKQAMRAAFERTGRPYAEDLFDRATRRLDAYGDDWVAARTATCQATHVRGIQSDTLLDVRMQCLNRRLGELSALTRLASRQGNAGMRRAVDAVISLTPARACAQLTRADALSQPDSPGLRKKLEPMWARYDEAAAQLRFGNYERALKIVAAIDPDDVNHDPFTAKLLYLRADLERVTGDAKAAEATLHEVIRVAAAAKDDSLLARAWIMLTAVVGGAQARVEDALALESVVEAAILRAGDDGELRARWLSTSALLASAQGELATARGQLEQALAIRREVFDADDLRIADLSDRLGANRLQAGKHDEAPGYFERAIDAYEEALGARHPRVADTLVNLAESNRRVGKFESAQKHLRRAIGIWESALGADSVKLAAPLNNLAAVLSDQGKHAAAQPLLERGLALRRKHLRPDHPKVANSLHALGIVLASQRRFAKARVHFEQALKVRQRGHGPNHAAVGGSLLSIGALLANQGKYREAKPYFERALKINEAALGPEHPYLAYVLTNLGTVQIHLRNHDSAVRFLERSLAIQRKQPGNPVVLAETQFSLARALWATRRDRRRAVDLARRADKGYEAAGNFKSERAKVATWLKKRVARR